MSKDKAKKLHLRPVKCLACEKVVQGRLTTGKEVYPDKPDLKRRRFYICDSCKGFIGCHDWKKCKNVPIGSIPTPEIAEKRREVFEALKPIIDAKVISKKRLYNELGKALDKDFNIASIETEKEADIAIKAISLMKGLLLNETA